MKIGDKILIVLVIVLIILSFVFIKRQGIDKNKKYISVQVDGKEIKKIMFDDNMNGKKLPIETEFGYNLMEIGNEEVRVIEASCPDKIDVLQGSISEVGEMIVCLPNRLVIEIKDMNDSDNNLDIINK